MATGRGGGMGGGGGGTHPKPCSASAKYPDRVPLLTPAHRLARCLGDPSRRMVPPNNTKWLVMAKPALALDCTW